MRYPSNWIGVQIASRVFEAVGMSKRTRRNAEGKLRTRIYLSLRNVDGGIPFAIGKPRGLTKAAREFLAIAEAL
jgi:hypothetical protein